MQTYYYYKYKYGYNCTSRDVIQIYSYNIRNSCFIKKISNTFCNVIQEEIADKECQSYVNMGWRRRSMQGKMRLMCLEPTGEYGAI